MRHRIISLSGGIMAKAETRAPPLTTYAAKVLSVRFMIQRQSNAANCSTRSAVMLALSLTTAVLSAFAGCEGDVVDRDKSLPAPLPETLPYEFHGKLFRAWGGDYFDMRIGQVIHFVCLEGVDSPKHGQPFAGEAWHELRRITNEKQLRVVVKHLDESKVAFVRAWVPADSETDQEIDVGLELIKRGLGWYDGNTFEGDTDYQSAEAEARKAKLGLWSEPDPVPPWEFEEPQ